MTVTVPQVLVIGDLMLDVFSEGHASRLSPEAPVPILANPRHRRVLGGAGNTALNAHPLGASVALATFVGNDEAGRTCAALLDDNQIGSALILAPESVTTVKTRFVAAGQQIMRLDIESPLISDASHDRLLAAVAGMVDTIGCIVISDYQKGAIAGAVARGVIDIAQHLGVPVTVDSKCRDFTMYRGASVITPNHLEASNATGEADPERAAKVLSDVTQGEVIVTLGADGMLVHTGERVERIPSQVREVADVTGAGDTVTAAVAVALAEGATAVEAARWATAAAAVAVEHRGTYAVKREQVEQALTERGRVLPL